MCVTSCRPAAALFDVPPQSSVIALADASTDGLTDVEQTRLSAPSDDEAGHLTNVTLVSGVAELSWDTGVEQLIGSNNADIPGVLISHADGHSLPNEDRPLVQADPDGLPPVAPLPRSPSSRGTTPDATQNTVLQVSPALRTPAAPPSSASPISAAQVAPHDAPEPITDGVPVLGAAAAMAADEDSGSLESFKEFLDVAVDDGLELRRNVGRRKIDVLLHNEYEYRRDRATEGVKLTQLWVCRFASRTKCKGRFHLSVKDLSDFTEGATISRLTHHNHAPHRVKTYGLDEVTEIVSVDSSTTNDASLSTSHAISQISEGDFSMDFGQSNLDARARSSPVAASRGSWSNTVDITTPATTLDTSWDLVGVSQEDLPGCQAVRHIRRTNSHLDLPGTPPEPPATNCNT